MNKKGFVDMEILTTPAFVILMLLSVGATSLGYIWGKNMGWDSFPLWQLLFIIVAEVIACYIFVARES